MKECVESIVLQYLKYGENSMIAQLYTREYGRLTCLIKNIHAKKSSKVTALQPIYLVEMELNFQSRKNIHTVYNLRILHPYAHIPFEITKSSLSFFLAEILNKTLRETEQNVALFDFLKYAFLLLDRMQDKISNFHLVFLIQLSRFLGFAPNDNYSLQTPYFELQKGRFVSSSTGYGLSREESLLFYKIQNSPLQETHLLPIDNSLRERLLKSVLQYYRFHLEDVGMIKSLDVLKELFR